jgi:hypothetical protein
VAPPDRCPPNPGLQIGNLDIRFDVADGPTEVGGDQAQEPLPLRRELADTQVCPEDQHRQIDARILAQIDSGAHQ